VLILAEQGQKLAILSRNRKSMQFLKYLIINYFFSFSFLSLRRLCSGSGYFLKSFKISQEAKNKQLARFLLLYRVLIWGSSSLLLQNQPSKSIFCLILSK